MSTITVDRAVLEQALEALDTLDASPSGVIDHYELERRKQALRAALAQQEQEHQPGCALLKIPSRDCDCRQEQEPVAALVHRELVEVHADGTETWAETPLYTHPPRREWQGLTVEDIALIDWEKLRTRKDAIRAVEQALKEKNHE